MNMERAFLNFIQYCIDENKEVPASLGEIDWDLFFAFAKKQAILGVVFQGMQRLGPGENRPSKELIYQWFSMSEQIKRRNQKLNAAVVEVSRQLLKDGFPHCILKGQGNAVMYPNPYMRTSGDIDIWLDGSRKRIVDYVRGNHMEEGICYHHIEARMSGQWVELHFIPSYFNNPFYNRRLQKWFSQQKKQQFGNDVDLPDGGGKIFVPTVEFNVVYQLCHLMYHFFAEGIGLRQMMDYYFLLKRRDECPEKNEDLQRLLKYLGLYRFAGAVMYVEKELLGLEEKYMIIPVQKRKGEMLQEEILRGGNFGKFDTKYDMSHRSTAKTYFSKIYRNLHFIREYAGEALCEPIFRTGHFVWRLWNRK